MVEPSPSPGWYPDPAGSGQQRYFDGAQWADHSAGSTPPAGTKRRISVAAKIAIGVAAVFAVLVVGVLIAEGFRGDEPRYPRPTPDQQFHASIADIPIRGGDDPVIVARSVCLAFKRTAGTKLDEAQRTMAAQNGWTLDQATAFLKAATTRYCPEYRFGS